MGKTILTCAVTGGIHKQQMKLVAVPARMGSLGLKGAESTCV